MTKIKKTLTILGTIKNEENYKTLLVRMPGGTTTLENDVAAFYGVKHALRYDPAIPLMSICPRERKTFVYTKSYT